MLILRYIQLQIMHYINNISLADEAQLQVVIGLAVGIALLVIIIVLSLTVGYFLCRRRSKKTYDIAMTEAETWETQYKSDAFKVSITLSS